MSNGFNWRDSESTSQPVNVPPPSEQRVSQGAKAGYQALTVWLPAPVSGVTLSVDEWLPAADTRLGGDDKIYIEGFCSALQLSRSQRVRLLELYAERYHHALKRAGSNPAKRGMAKRAANRWLGAGASGFVVREQ